MLIEFAQGKQRAERWPRWSRLAEPDKQTKQKRF
jgi:hypothetical protein